MKKLVEIKSLPHFDFDFFGCRLVVFVAFEFDGCFESAFFG